MTAGSIVDRQERRRIYLIATIGQAACSILLAAQALLGKLPVLGVLALVAAQSGFGAGGGPAARTFVPQLLPADQVATGLALNRISFQAAMLVGPALGGLVIGRTGVAGCYLLDALTFLAILYGVLALPVMRPDGNQSQQGRRVVIDGLRFVVHSDPVRAALLTDVAVTVLSFPVSVFPLVNAQRFGNDPRTLGLFLTAIALGGVLASIFAGAFTRAHRVGVVMLCGAAGWSAALLLFALTSNRWIGLGWLIVAGIADTVAVVSRSTIVTLATPDPLRGRVGAAEQIVGQAGPELGNMRGGLVAAATTGAVSLATGALLAGAAVTLIGLTAPALRSVTALTGREALTGSPTAGSVA